MNIPPVEIQSIRAEWLNGQHLSLDVLRLDKIHPIAGGNKYFKLKPYLREALLQQKTTIATFGGAWSNHLTAFAFACKEAGLKSIGIVRGEKPDRLSYTLEFAMQQGMQLHFISRTEYRNKEEIRNRFENNNLYWIDEGGYGILGAKGASEILNTIDSKKYSHIIAAVGTGTMLAGLMMSSAKTQKIIGISVMKGNDTLLARVIKLLNTPPQADRLIIIDDAHFGGYGKHPPMLIDFINEVFLTQSLPLDIVYTAKTFFAIKTLAAKGFFENGSRLLMVHSGGLQGNKSLPPGALVF